MTREEQYDQEIAPLLLEAAEKAKELGMSIVARVEIEGDFYGLTTAGEHSSFSQKLALYAAKANGNFDALGMTIIRDGVDCSNSIFLHRVKL